MVVPTRALACFAAWWVCSGTAHADVRGEGLDSAWTRALADLEVELAARDDVDADVAIVVSARRAGGVLVVARRPTGEVAEREVERADELAATILALVVVPARTRMMPAFDDEIPTVLRTREVAVPRARAPRVELAGGVGARWQGQLALGATAAADVGFGDGWLVGATAGWVTSAGSAPDGPFERVAARTVMPPFTLRTFEIGAEVGHRFAIGPTDVAALVGPRLAMSTRSSETESQEFDVARLAAGVRARWAGSGRVQLQIGVDISVDLAAAPDDDAMTARGWREATWGLTATLGGRFEVTP